MIHPAPEQFQIQELHSDRQRPRQSLRAASDRNALAGHAREENRHLFSSVTLQCFPNNWGEGEC